MTDPIPTPRGSSLAYPEMVHPPFPLGLASADNQSKLFVRNKAWSEDMWEKDPGVCIQTDRGLGIDA